MVIYSLHIAQCAAAICSAVIYESKSLRTDERI